MKSKVYFSKTISPEKVIELIELSGKKLPGSIAVKVHSGEVGWVICVYFPGSAIITSSAGIFVNFC